MFVTISDPPEELSITGYKSGEVLKEGSVRRLKCTAMSGHPLPHLEWFAGNNKVEGARIEKAESGTFVSSEISIRVDRDDNGKEYQCSAQNLATRTPVTRSVQLQVTFPASKVEIEVEPQHPVEGSAATLRCTTDSSFPESQIVWYRDNERLKGERSSSKSSQFGGVSTSSVIRTMVTEDNIHSVYRCEARHQPTSKTVSGKIKISAQCKYKQVL